MGRNYAIKSRNARRPAILQFFLVLFFNALRIAALKVLLGKRGDALSG